MQQAARADLADPAHPMNRFKGKLVEGSFAEGLPTVRTVRSTADNPLSAKDHDAMAKQHARLATMLRINGDEGNSQAQLAAAKFHRA